MQLFTRNHVLRAAGIALALGSSFLPQAASAARIENPVAVFSGLDKITGRITTSTSMSTRPSSSAPCR